MKFCSRLSKNDFQSNHNCIWSRHGLRTIFSNSLKERFSIKPQLTKIIKPQIRVHFQRPFSPVLLSQRTIFNQTTTANHLSLGVWLTLSKNDFQSNHNFLKKRMTLSKNFQSNHNDSLKERFSIKPQLLDDVCYPLLDFQSNHNYMTIDF